MLRLGLLHFGHVMRWQESQEKTMMLEKWKAEGDEEDQT